MIYKVRTSERRRFLEACFPTSQKVYNYHQVHFLSISRTVGVEGRVFIYRLVHFGRFIKK
jgi:hypothetical protein